MKNSSYERFFDETGHLDGEAVALYVDALKLDRFRDLPSTLQEHVQSCQHCKMEITGLFSMIAKEDYSKVGSHPYFDKETVVADKRVFSVLKIAATLAIAVGIGLLAYYSLFHVPTTPIERPSLASSVGRDTTQLQSSRDATGKGRSDRQVVFAARFTESPELEDLVTASTRSAETSIQFPLNGDTVRSGSRFQWTTGSQPPFDVAIVDNQRHTVRSFQVGSCEFVLRDSLQGGLYYWKLGAEGSLLKAGKFIVR
jgi:hypothetical protein